MPEAFSLYLPRQGKIRIWAISESLKDLLYLAQSARLNLNEFDKVSMEKRQKEWLTIRLLMHDLLPERDLLFLPSGKPWVENGPHLSFSHSGVLTGMMISPAACGLDIQFPDSRLFKISHRFCNESEQQNAPQNPDARLAYFTSVWSVKEAIFKCYGSNVDFARDITVHPFNNEHSTIEASYSGTHGKRTFQLSRFWLDGYCVVHTI